jgi:ethanolamine permease
MKHGSVEYRKADSAFFEKRGLKRYAGLWSLWALGVGAVISGDFFGWNFGMATGGFGGLLVAALIVTAMYLGLCFSIAEMTAALPHAGGAYSFARSSMGPWGGFITGMAENMEYVLTPAVIVVGIGSYLGAIFGTPGWAEPIWWLVCYGMFVGLNIWGVEISFKFTVIITLISLAILTVFFAGAIPIFDASLLFNIPAGAGHSTFLPAGAKGILICMPFAIWFFLAIEQLPLAAEEANQPQKDLPKGIVLGISTLIVYAFGVLFLNCGIGGGAAAMSTSSEPLFEGFKAIFGSGLGSKLLSFIAVAGLVASFHSIIYAYGRQVFSLSRAGYFPSFLSLTHKKFKTPHVALIGGAVLGYAVALVIKFMGSSSPVGAVLLNMAVFGAVISYCLQMTCYIILKLKHKNIERPYSSPMGIPGAVIALVVAAVTLVSLFVVDPIYQKVVIGAAIWYLLGIAYFAFVGRKQLILSPEEKFALDHEANRKKGVVTSVVTEAGTLN